MSKSVSRQACFRINHGKRYLLCDSYLNWFGLRMVYDYTHSIKLIIANIVIEFDCIVMTGRNVTVSGSGVFVAHKPDNCFYVWFYYNGCDYRYYLGFIICGVYCYRFSVIKYTFLNLYQIDDYHHLLSNLTKIVLHFFFKYHKAKHVCYLSVMLFTVFVFF